MIRSFGDRETQLLFETGKSARYSAIAKVAGRKLAQLDAATTLEFLRAPRGNRLEALKGDRAGVSTASGSTTSSGSASCGPGRVRSKWKSWTITDGGIMFKNGMHPVHPGEVLREDYLAPLEMSANALANALKVPATRINDIVRERRGVTADTALRLARYFGGDAQSWLNLQTAYDLRVAEIDNGTRIKREVRTVHAAV